MVISGLPLTSEQVALAAALAQFVNWALLAFAAGATVVMAVLFYSTGRANGWAAAWQSIARERDGRDDPPGPGR